MTIEKNSVNDPHIKINGLEDVKRDLAGWELLDDTELAQKIARRGAETVINEMKEFSALVKWPEVIVWPFGPEVTLEIRIDIEKEFRRIPEDEFAAREYEEASKHMLEISKRLVALSKFFAAQALKAKKA